MRGALHFVAHVAFVGILPREFAIEVPGSHMRFHWPLVAAAAALTGYEFWTVIRLANCAATSRTLTFQKQTSEILGNHCVTLLLLSILCLAPNPLAGEWRVVLFAIIVLALAANSLLMTSWRVRIRESEVVVARGFFRRRHVPIERLAAVREHQPDPETAAQACLLDRESDVVVELNYLACADAFCEELAARGIPIEARPKQCPKAEVLKRWMAFVACLILIWWIALFVPELRRIISYEP